MRICVSRCLAGEACRWKGDRRPSVLPALPRGAEIVPFCPECEAGLGVPRPPIELVQVEAAEPSTASTASTVSTPKDPTP
jgi:uncharacterized protein YbbK (DUF523 family)